MLFMRWLVC